MIKHFLLVSWFVFGASLVLAGCGIKPDTLDPPPGAEGKVFPRTYPDPSTDLTP